MRKLWLFSIVHLGVLAGVLSGAAGCKQGVGSRCQLITDCQSGLVCVLPNGGTCAAGGYCQEPTNVGRPCETSAQCAAGFVCTPTPACPYDYRRVCMPTNDGGADLSVPDLLPPPVDGS